MPFSRILRLVMSAFYAVVGLLFLLTDVLADRIPDHRTVLGAVLLGYGLLRLVMWLRGRRSHRPDHP